MQKRTGFVIDMQGRPVAGATVQVNLYPGGGAATIYSDDGVAQQANPLVTDSRGRYDYYAANGHYSELITTSAGAQPAINDILFDDSLNTNQQFVAATGTGNALVVAAFQAGYTLQDGDELRVRAPGTNTITNPTIQLAGVGTLTIYRAGGRPLAKYDIKGPGHEVHLRYRAAPARMELLGSGRLDWLNARLDFGVVGDGVVDDTVSLQAAVAALPTGGTLVIDGTPLISDTITIDDKVSLIFSGPHSPDGAQVSYLQKALTGVAFTALRISAVSVHWKGGGVRGHGLGTDLGDGIEILTNYPHFEDVTVTHCGGVGFKVGSASIASNYNGWKFIRCYAVGNSSHGWHITDQAGFAGPNCNVGSLRDCFANNNQGDGIRLGNMLAPTLDTVLCEGNVGAGLRIQTECRWATIIGGDYEANTGGNIVIEDQAPFTQIIGRLPSTQVDSDRGYYTQKHNYYESKENVFTPAIAGLATATVSGTLNALTGSFPDNVVVTIDAAAHGYVTGETVWLYGGTAINGTNAAMLGAHVVTKVNDDRFTISVPTGKTEAPMTVAAGTVLLRTCGVYSVQVGRWWFADNARSVEFFAYVKSSDKKTISGQAAFILPYGLGALANAFQTINTSFHEGVTMTANAIQIAAIAVPDAYYASMWECYNDGSNATALDVSQLGATHGYVVTGKVRVA